MIGKMGDGSVRVLAQQLHALGVLRGHPAHYRGLLLDGLPLLRGVVLVFRIIYVSA